MKTIPELLRKVHRQITMYLGLVSLIVVLVILVIEIKVSAELRLQLVSGDKVAFVEGLEESILFDDIEGRGYILHWLKDRHKLADAVVVNERPECHFLALNDPFFQVCWSWHPNLTAFHRLQGGQYLVLAVPIQFFSYGFLIPAYLFFFLIFATFSLLMRDILRKLGRSIHQPIAALAHAASQGHSLEMTANLQEISTLADAVKSIQDIERHKAVAMITQTLTHDIKNSLAVFELAGRSQTLEEFQGWTGELEKSLERIWMIIDRIGVSEVEATIKRIRCSFDLGTIGHESQRIYGRSDVAIHVSWQPTDLPFYLDVVAIERVILNLVKNSAEAGAKNVTIAGTIKDLDLMISVQDDGIGIPEHCRENLFQRGQSFGKVEGHGIGLFNVKTIVSGHGGTVVYRQEGGLSIFEIKLKGVILESPQKLDKFDEFIIGSEPPKLQSVLISIEDSERKELLLTVLAKLPIKIYLDEPTELNASLVFTDDQDVMEKYLAIDIPIMMDNGKDAPEKLARQIMRRVMSRSEPINERADQI